MITQKGSVKDYLFLALAFLLLGISTIFSYAGLKIMFPHLHQDLVLFVTITIQVSEGLLFISFYNIRLDKYIRYLYLLGGVMLALLSVYATYITFNQPAKNALAHNRQIKIDLDSNQVKIEIINSNLELNAKTSADLSASKWRSNKHNAYLLSTQAQQYQNQISALIDKSATLKKQLKSNTNDSYYSITIWVRSFVFEIFAVMFFSGFGSLRRNLQKKQIIQQQPFVSGNKKTETNVSIGQKTYSKKPNPETIRSNIEQHDMFLGNRWPETSKTSETLESPVTQITETYQLFENHEDFKNNIITHNDNDAFQKHVSNVTETSETPNVSGRNKKQDVSGNVSGNKKRVSGVAKYSGNVTSINTGVEFDVTLLRTQDAIAAYEKLSDTDRHYIQKVLNAHKNKEIKTLTVRVVAEYLSISTVKAGLVTKIAKEVSLGSATVLRNF